ncbi:RecQ family ATP-dependent DNA helicase [Rhodopirellula sp. JC740]|uniref:ATP-dependent DNA helicase RecQ n=1 Tax=Rhodopirellula halodulae TaxID=2894198 RepID=A0ABS8NIS7_9BACT|nr:RecQ family ATP-dependent DNA helicase [Rhodopirellula sp. JC740]MCC9642386.1 RecQ family ATP-dependent DNA helicase [Rhodopirellula sp. JC740]
MSSIASQSNRSADPDSLLPKFGLTQFRPGQRDVVDALANGSDCLCVMPTGGGKSLCYQLPSLAREGTTIVVSPLIALMKDQVDALQKRGIQARLLNSTQSHGQQESVMEEMAAGRLDMIYVAPERLRNGRFLDVVPKANVTLLAVDEAHCVSEWGHDFRPDYSRLGRFRDRYLGGVQTIGLTATATPTVRDDICELLNLKQPKIFVTGFARTNLRFSVTPCNNDVAKQNALRDYLAKQSGAGIIYGATRKRCEEIAEWLPEKTGRHVGVYHAGMHPDERRRVQESFMNGDLSAIVATNAFGMGIDKSDIRFVVHYNMPGSLEAYYQEAGRAGRDGEMSQCCLLFAYADRQIQEFFIENRYPSRETVKKVYEYLLSRDEDPIELTLDQVREAIGVRDGSEAIGTSETLLSKAGVLRRLDASANQAVLRIDSDAPTLLDFLPPEAKLKRQVMTGIEKIVGSRRGEDVFVRLSYLATRSGVERKQLTRTLRELTKLKSFDYIPPFRGRAVHIMRRDVPFHQLKIDFDELARRKKAEYEKLEAVIDFARSTSCRQHVILNYFGDPNASECGKCDHCDPAGDCMPAETGTNSAGNTLPTANELQVGGGLSDQPGLDMSALTTAVRVILSGVTRTHGRLGKNLIAQMLAGSKNKKVTQLRLCRLSTYGMLSGMKQAELTDAMDSLLTVGLLDQKELNERRPTVHMTDLGRNVMNGQVPLPSTLQLKFPLAKKLAKIASKIESGDVAEEEPGDAPMVPTSVGPTLSPPAPSSPATEPSIATEATQPTDPEPLTSNDASELLDQDLSDRIKRFRRKRSAALNVAPHRILSESTIKRLVQSKPANVTQLESVSGVSNEFIEAYGSDLLELIANTLSEHESSLPPTTSTPTPQPTEIPATPTKSSPTQKPAQPSVFPDEAETVAVDPSAWRHEYWTWRLCRDGYTLQQVAEIRGEPTDVLVDHLIAAAKAGQTIDPNWADSPANAKRLRNLK